MDSPLTETQPDRPTELMSTAALECQCNEKVLSGGNCCSGPTCTLADEFEESESEKLADELCLNSIEQLFNSYNADLQYQRKADMKVITDFIMAFKEWSIYLVVITIPLVGCFLLDTLAETLFSESPYLQYKKYFFAIFTGQLWTYGVVKLWLASKELTKHYHLLKQYIDKSTANAQPDQTDLLNNDLMIQGQPVLEFEELDDEVQRAYVEEKKERICNDKQDIINIGAAGDAQTGVAEEVMTSPKDKDV